MRPILLALVALVAAPLAAQPAGDCPYPVLFLHGYTGSQASWEPFTGNADVASIWGPRADVFHAVLNAYENEERIAGPDGITGTTDDDVLVQFVNEANDLAPGCVYASNWENFWDENPAAPMLEQNSGDSPGGFFASESDSNEEAAQKQGYALGRMIAAVLAANPSKDRVILVGHSMGGLIAREYLQRRDGSGTPMWWADPAAPGGHRVARLLTVGTPHRGSNLFGNPFRSGPEAGAPQRDGTPDINSAAVRDLRYNYFCFFCDAPGPYLFGGDEGDIASGFHTDDVDLDGDESSLITGINIDGRDQGFSDAWNGTTDNPAMPLPTDVRYTWLTSDVGTGGDLVVDLARQWISAEGLPVPSDGTPFRLTDSLLTDVQHLAQQEDTDAVARGLDEPDYPAHAYGLNVGTTYAGLASVRSFQAPDGPPTTDPDWFSFVSTGGAVRVDLAPGASLGGRLDLYDVPPGDYSTAPSALGVDFAPGTPSVTIPASAMGAGTHFVRVRHDSVGPLDWRQPYTLTITEEAPVLLSVTIAPRRGPIVFGPEGGQIRYKMKVFNDGPADETTEIWTEALLPDGSVVGPLFRPRTVTAPAGGRAKVQARQRVPAEAPAGTYTYRAYIGTFPTPTATASFTFEKTGGSTAAVVLADWKAELDDGADLLDDFSLEAPRPNPFASRTSIAFSLDAEASVSLAVFDALGRRVAVLAEGLYRPGTHRAVFEASDLAPGAYVVRLEAGGEVLTHRVVRMR
ncbi:MAG: T9SS type A sorting domain-containing protein [Bacteroidota bacterium]